jgi:hypothetical protein
LAQELLPGMNQQAPGNNSWRIVAPSGACTPGACPCASVSLHWRMGMRQGGLALPGACPCANEFQIHVQEFQIYVPEIYNFYLININLY